MPKLSPFQWIGLFLTLTLGSGVLLQLPAGAQVEPNSKSPAKAEPEKTTPPSEAAAESPRKTAAPAAPSPDAKKLFAAAREKLPNRIYRANIVQRLRFPNRTLEAKGKILRGQKLRMRLEFHIQTGGTTGQLLQVCNGDKLWTERRVNDVTRLTVQDVKEILGKANVSAGVSPENLVVAEMGLGGITALLASLDRTMDFGKPETVVIDGEEFYRVDGQWNEGFQARIQSNPQLKKGLSETLPDGARVYFDTDDFPRRIQYLKKEAQHDVMRPMITLDFVDVQWLTEADVKPSEFEYQAPERVYPEDVTKNYVDQLQSSPASPPRP